MVSAHSLSPTTLAQLWWHRARTLPRGPDPLLQRFGALELLPRRCRELEETSETRIAVPEGLAAISGVRRPTPLTEAPKLARAFGARRLFLKREDLGPTGSQKALPAFAGAYFAKQDGASSVVTYSLAGNWAYAAAAAAHRVGLPCTVFVAESALVAREQLIRHCRQLGAEVVGIPCDGSQDFASTLLKAAVAEARRRTGARLMLGCHGNHPAIFQSLIGREVRDAVEGLSDRLDALVCSAAGGATAVGLFAPFLEDETHPAFLIGQARGFEAGSLRHCRDAVASFSGLNTRCRSAALRSLLQRGVAQGLVVSAAEAQAAAAQLEDLEGISCAEETGYAIAAARNWLATQPVGRRGVAILLSGASSARNLDVGLLQPR